MKVTVTVKIDEQTWIDFRKKCIDKNKKYSYMLEKILNDYLDGVDNEQKKE